MALALYARVMRRSDAETAALRALVDGAELPSNGHPMDTKDAPRAEIARGMG